MYIRISCTVKTLINIIYKYIKVAIFTFCLFLNFILLKLHVQAGDGENLRHIETVELHNDGSGLGFGIVGGRSTGVIVKTILPGGVADRVSH